MLLLPVLPADGKKISILIKLQEKDPKWGPKTKNRGSEICDRERRSETEQRVLSSSFSVDMTRRRSISARRSRGRVQLRRATTSISFVFLELSPKDFDLCSPFLDLDSQVFVIALDFAFRSRSSTVGPRTKCAAKKAAGRLPGQPVRLGCVRVHVNQPTAAY